MSCKDLCMQYKASRPIGKSRYGSGQKRCQICEVFIQWEGFFCPCCGCRLRSTPRNRQWKARLSEKKRY